MGGSKLNGMDIIISLISNSGFFPGELLKYDKTMDRMVISDDVAAVCLTYQLQTVWYLLTVAMTGDGELGFDSGEGAWEIATTSKEGSRRANYPILL